MPCRGFICPISREKVGWDHFETCDHWRRGDERRPAFPPPLARLLAIKEQADVRHQGIELTATRCMGCPRAALISMTQDWWLDPSRRAVSAKGVAMHEALGDPARGYDPAVWATEQTDSVRLTLVGELFGVQLSAKVDVHKLDMGEIVDMKFPMDWSVAYRDKTGRAKVEHTVQLNIERLLLAQQPWAVEAGYDPDRVKLTVWDFGCGKAEGPVPLRAPHMTEEEMLQVVPFSNTTRPALYTIAEIIELWTVMRARHEEVKGDPVAVERLCAEVPCVGESQFGGDGCNRYCDVYKESAELTRKWGRPENT